MKLKALDQVHVSSVQSDSLRPGQEFVLSDAAGADLLKKHPAMFEKIGDDVPEEKIATAPAAAKKEAPAQNKVEPAPTNKADKRRNADKSE